MDIKKIVQKNMLVEEKGYKNIEQNYKIWDNADTWINDGEEWSEHFGDTDALWNDHIYPKIKDYIKGKVLEIAPGRGRMTRKLLESDIDLSVIDLSSTCINRCRERYGDKIRNYYVGSGSDLKDIKSNSVNFVFSFDSFVHMHEEVIESYLSEIERVLKLGGHCWIHHSCLSGGNDDNFQNIAGRSNMDLDKFKSITEKYRLTVTKQELIRWDAPGNPEWLHDGLTLVKKNNS